MSEEIQAIPRASEEPLSGSQQRVGSGWARRVAEAYTDMSNARRRMREVEKEAAEWRKTYNEMCRRYRAARSATAKLCERGEGA